MGKNNWSRDERSYLSKLKWAIGGTLILALVWYGFLGYLIYLITQALIKYIGG